MMSIITTSKEASRDKLRSCAGRERRCHRRRRNLTTLFSEQADDITQQPNEHEESSHDADNSSCLDETPEDNPEDEQGPWSTT